ncbi:MAG: M61 family metallopeptidase [Flavobacteriales bacterium]|nr:M61 family metallopeptidase [Flavobacteriales bacterium]MCB9363095.1 M61 family metallopeptidase [Flavobacteriales bacterium]
MKITLFILSFFTLSFISGSEINYEVSMPEPHTHYFQVKMEISDFEKEYVDIKMPVWAPGSYLVREFAKSVEDLSAKGNNKELQTEKVDKNTWRIHSKNAKNISISYSVYAFEMSVRTSFLDASHGYFNGTSIFMFIEELKNNPISLEIIPFKDWKKVSTSLTKVGDFKYTAPNYDILVDSPVEIGNHITFDFTSAGVLHHVAMYGEGNYDIEKLKIDMAKVTQAATDVFGENPNKEYTFIIHNLTNGSGGLEHLSSTTLQVNRWTYDEDSYKGFLSLVAHEYFHLWNVKRIRPIELGPFDYNNENYTDLLWVMEGFTSYYDELLLYRAGIYSEDEIIGKFKGSINNIENQPGNKVQPVADASFDAWIKAYRPTENSYNTTISYYTKGSVIANMLDLKIINATKGEKTLDDVMKYLYNEYYKKEQRGFTSPEIKKAIETVSGLDLTDFFKNYIYGVETFDYPTIFGYAGFKIETVLNQKPSFGVRLSNNIIKSVTRNSSAYDGGLNVNDEIIAINGYRVNDNLIDFIETKNVGDNVSVLISRDEIIQTIEFPLKERGNTYYYILKESKEMNTVCKKWLRQL